MKFDRSRFDPWQEQILTEKNMMYSFIKANIFYEYMQQGSFLPSHLWTQHSTGDQKIQDL